MGHLTWSADHAALVVLDTSVAINLNATGCAAEILRALPNRALAVDLVSAELEGGRGRDRQDAALMRELVAAGLIEIVTLENPAQAIFETLVAGSAAETLDDGEAATIAYGVQHGVVAVIDERKAIRICRERFPALRLGCTVDLLSHPEVLRTLGRERVSQAVVSALQLARMRALPRHIEWIVKLIGSEQAALCPSLPRSARMQRTGVAQERPRRIRIRR